MSLDTIVSVVITRETQSVTRAGFGTYAIISEFLTSKTTVAFDRHRYYASLTEMTADGWAASDKVYLAAQRVFAQNPKLNRVMVGRKDAADSTWADALTAIQVAIQDWYAFEIDSFVLAHQQSAATWASTQTKLFFVGVPDIAVLVFDADFVASNSITITITKLGIADAVGPVLFTTDHDTTMTALKSALDSAGYPTTIDPTDVSNRTLLITTGLPSATVDAAVTGGASQPGDTTTYRVVPAATTNDFASWAESQNYDRAITYYDPDEDADHIEAAAAGEALPFTAGGQTWAFKTLAGVDSYSLTSTEVTQALGKNANIYTAIAGVDVTQEGKVASGEYIDVIRGIDQLQARIQEGIFAELVNVRKIPFTDDGVQVVTGLLQQAIDRSVQDGLLTADYEVTAPLVENVDAADKTNRLLPDVTFTATLAGAIHKITINGVVSV